MSAISEDAVSRLSGSALQHLAELESLHRAVQQSHERAQRDLDEAVNADRRELHAVWNHYRTVVADLNRVTANIESLRLTLR